MILQDYYTNNLTKHQKMFIGRCVNRNKVSCKLSKCLCGCGGYSKEGFKYINGHNRPWLGKTRIDMLGENNPAKKPEVRKKLSENNPMRNPVHVDKLCGQNNYNWKGGERKYCVVFNQLWWRNKIRKRDSKTCQICGITEMLQLKVYERKLSIHHIDHNPMNCEFDNCVLVCDGCNSKN